MLSQSVVAEVEVLQLGVGDDRWAKVFHRLVREIVSWQIKIHQGAVLFKHTSHGSGSIVPKAVVG